jgi:predicted nucleic acid-binding Zn ribbon protein
MARFVFVLILALVLILPQWAEAACAWVVWLYVFAERTGASYYTVDSAYPTREECGAAVRRVAIVLKSSGYTVSGDHPGSTEVMGDKETTTRKYYCLPDTIDPRGPKP